MVMNVTKLSKKMKKKLVEYRKKYYKKEKKRFIIIERNYSNLENFGSFRESIRKFFFLCLCLKISLSTNKNVKKNY